MLLNLLHVLQLYVKSVVFLDDVDEDLSEFHKWLSCFTSGSNTVFFENFQIRDKEVSKYVLKECTNFQSLGGTRSKIAVSGSMRYWRDISLKTK